MTTDKSLLVRRISAVNIKHMLEVPIYYGDWVMKHREFVLVCVELESGLVGCSYGLTREGPVSEIISRSIAPQYVGKSVADPSALFYGTLWSNHAVHAAGIGMRALSLVELASWDALARSREKSIHSLLAPEHPRVSLPATAIVGYPPSTSAAETKAMIEDLLGRGWQRFKLPIAPTLEASIERLEAARDAAPAGWIGFDANMVFRSAHEVLEFERSVRHLQLGWIEDLVPPGDALVVADARRDSGTPVAMGDEQGGSYHPQALLAAGAIDVLRVDATTNGGITGIRSAIGSAQQNGVAVAPHMFPHIHARLAGAFGLDVPIEWGVVGTGVHPMDDGLERPTIVDGRMEPLEDQLGFGNLVNLDWVQSQEVSDPDRVLERFVDGGPL